MNGGLDNWNPGNGGGANPAKMAALLSTEAKDNPDSINGTNKLANFSKTYGSSKKPKGLFGTQGQEF